ETKVRELEEANQRMQELNQLKGDFLLMAAEDLQGPVALTQEYLQLLEEQLSTVANPTAVADLCNLSERMKSGVGRMQRVSQEIEEVSNLMSGLLALNKSRVH